MNADVAAAGDSLNVLNLHMAHMAESVIQSSTPPSSKSADDGVSVAVVVGGVQWIDFSFASPSRAS